jgi:hypothetical protein
MEVLESEQMRFNLGYAWRIKYRHSLGIFNISIFRPHVAQMLINVTLQYMEIRFAHGLRVDALIFQTELDLLLSEVNAYIPHFTTNHSISPRRRKRLVVAAAFTIASGIFSAWRFYKDYQFKKNLRRTIHYIMDKQKEFKQGILTNHRNLLSLADITAINFRKVPADFSILRMYVQNKFASYGDTMLQIHAHSMYYK